MSLNAQLQSPFIFHILPFHPYGVDQARSVAVVTSAGATIMTAPYDYALMLAEIVQKLVGLTANIPDSYLTSISLQTGN